MITLLRFRKMIFVVLFFLMFLGTNSYAQNNTAPETVEPFKLDITSGKSIVMKSDINVKRISVGSPEIADFILLSPKEIYIKGKAAGFTNMILWQEGGITTIYDIEVTYDISRLKEKLYHILPDEKEIKIMSTNDSLTLSGRVSSAANLSQAMVLANSYAPKGKVNNLLTVGGTHQVMLEVKISEMSRSVGKELGIDLEVLSQSSNLAVSLLSGFGGSVAPAFDAALSYTRGDATWSGALNAAKADGLIKILAEPNLIALSGSTASFLAGGQYPIPVSNEDGITVEFKDFGIGLSFTPNVLSQDKIHINVVSSVSELDYSTAVQFTGYVVPGVSSRTATTTVELADGQTFVIAGLLSENLRENITKFPFLGDIPILGTLFRSSSFQKSETELVIFVTPRFIKPISKETIPDPGENYIEPSDVEFYLGIDRRPAKDSSRASSVEGNMDGQFGHSFEE